MKQKLNYSRICEELVEKKFADEGMIAFGRLAKNQNFNGGIVGANSWRYAICKAGDDIVFIPIGRSQIYYNNLYAMNKAKMKSLKVGGLLWRSYLELVTIDGGVKKCIILRNKHTAKKIVKEFGF